MAKYRIKARWKQQPEFLPMDWQRVVFREYERDLDFQEIAEINERIKDDSLPQREEQRRYPVLVLLVVLVLFLALGGAVRYLIIAARTEPQDISFLAESHELAQDEALRSLRESVVTVSGPRANGTGFNLRAEGLIVTNRHVVEDNSPAYVSFPDDGVRYRVRQWHYVEGYDLALGELSNAADLPHVALSEELPEEGADLIFIGNPLGYDWTISQAQLLEVREQELLLAGAIRSGSSGSPLFNERGEVIGVIYARLTQVENQGLAIPATVLFSYLQ